MKKKLMFLAVAALFLGGGVFTAMQLTNKEKVSDLTLANIEAMTIGGDDDDTPSIIPCRKDGDGCYYSCQDLDGHVMRCFTPNMKSQ